MMREDDRIVSIYNISPQQVHENIMDILCIFTSSVSEASKLSRIAHQLYFSIVSNQHMLSQLWWMKKNENQNKLVA